MPTQLVLTEPELRQALRDSRADQNWWRGRDAEDLMARSADTLRPLALHLHADPDDALSYAFETWQAIPDSVLDNEDCDLWSYTRAAVYRALTRESEAARRGLSVAGVRRAGARELDISTGLDGIDVGFTYSTPDEAPPAPIDIRTVRASAAVEHLLIMSGVSEDHRIILIDVLADIAENSPSKRAALARATSARDIIGIPMRQQQWKSLVEAILGTPSGRPGVIELAGNGHPAPTLEPHISSRLMVALTLAA